jgi:hypothetical protein
VTGKSAEIIPFRKHLPIEGNDFVPPTLPPVLLLRKQMGLTFDEALCALYGVCANTLTEMETLSPEACTIDLASISMRYFFFLSIHGRKRERNNVGCGITLLAIRQNLFELSYAEMGRIYGYTARQWYQFEVHDQILPREVLAQIEQDMNNLDLMRR